MSIPDETERSWTGWFYKDGFVIAGLLHDAVEGGERLNRRQSVQLKLGIYTPSSLVP
jgi:hypothetical protein